MKPSNESETIIEQEQPAPPPVRPSWKWLVVFLLLCTLVAGFTKVTTRPDVVPEAGVILELPERVLGMRGEELEISEAEKLILPDDTEFAKMNYSDAFGEASIGCQIVLSGGDRRSIHRPEACLPGQGWNMLSNEPMDIELPSGTVLTVQKLRLGRTVETPDGHRYNLPMVFLYWYVGSEMTTHDQFERIFRSNLDLLLHNRVHRWAYVVVSAPVLQGIMPGGLGEAETLERMTAFIQEAVPQFQRSEMAGNQMDHLAPSDL